jgi:4-amino-4-deoxy-L-arabinose transferase-like glycosyltransferase
MNTAPSQRPAIASDGPRTWLICILAAALLARGLLLIALAHSLSLQTSGYDVYAVHLLDGRGFTGSVDRSADSGLPPLYPFFLAGVYFLLGRNPISVAAVQIGIDLATVWLMYWIGKRVWNEKLGLLAAALFAFYPYLIFQDLTVNDTGLFLCLLAAGIALAYKARDSVQWRYALAVGAVIGLGALTKTFILAILPLLGFWWYRQVGLRRAATMSLAGGMMALAVIAPWIARNISVQKEFVLLSTNGGSNLHQGNNACVADYLARGWDAQWVDCLGRPPEGLNEVGEDRWHTRQAIDFLWNHPAEWPRLFGIKFLVLWSPAIMPSGLPPVIPAEESAVSLYQTAPFQIARILHLLYFGPLLALGLAGLVWVWRDRLLIGPLVIVLAVFTLFYVVFHPSTRYRSPADPFLFILSAYALLQLWDRARGRLRRSRPDALQSG